MLPSSTLVPELALLCPCTLAGTPPPRLFFLSVLPTSAWQQGQRKEISEHLRVKKAPQRLAWPQLPRNGGTFFSWSLEFRSCLIRQKLHSCHLGQDGGSLSSAQIWQPVTCPPPQRKTLLKERHHRNTSSWKKQSKGLEKNKLIASETNSLEYKRGQGKGQTEKSLISPEIRMRILCPESAGRDEG